ncbi:MULTISPECIES: hypothetical protein [Microbacterium]|uniref:Uncharacterized protein n=1 Tax=Microbacterium azadirachtae TaxID=582680 RepID=A0A0F0LPY3_9MICO|nr:MULTISPECIES: hypothetical protein [Microbacterium]KJL34325.1 hypothetical protein RS86_01112 [Microbacterium azadirachtae]
MSSNPILWVAAVIALGTLAAWIVQIVLSRRRRDDGRGPWWEGPWDEDERDR